MTLRAKFDGAFLLDKPLSEHHLAYLDKFCHVRHMKRSETLLAHEPDPLRKAVGLPVGSEGAYYTGRTAFGGHDLGHPSVIDSNRPPVGQPDIICQWTPNEDGSGIVWEPEMFDKVVSYFVPWIQYLANEFLEPCGYIVNGTVKWETEPYPFASEVTMRIGPAISRGEIVIRDNVVEVRNETMEWLDEPPEVDE